MKCLLVDDGFECKLIEETALEEGDLQRAADGYMAIVRYNDSTKAFEQAHVDIEEDPDDEDVMNYDIQWKPVK